MFNMNNSAGFNVLAEQIKSILKKEGPNLVKTALKDTMKNDPRYRKEMVDIIKKEMTNMANRTAQGINAVNTMRDDASVPMNEVYGRTIIGGNPSQSNRSLYKQMKNKIAYGVNTDKGSTLTNNGKYKIV